MYDKHTRSERWKKLLKKSKSMVKVAKKKFSENLITNLKYTDPSSWMKRMNKLGLASFQGENDGWHFETETKSDQILTDEMADYFANISKDFKPLRAYFITSPNILILLSLLCRAPLAPCPHLNHQLYPGEN